MRGHRPNALVCDGFQREWFLFVSADAAVIPDLAWRIYEEGHDVKYDVEAESDGRSVTGSCRGPTTGETMKTTREQGTREQATREEADERLDGIGIPNRYYRDDIGGRWIDGDGDRLQAWGRLDPGG